MIQVFILLLIGFHLSTIGSIEILNCCYDGNRSDFLFYDGLIDCSKPINEKLPTIYLHKNHTFLSYQYTKSAINWIFEPIQCSSNNQSLFVYQSSINNTEFVVTEDSSLWLFHKSILVSNQEYCFDTISGSVLVCLPKQNEEKALNNDHLKICCGSNDLFNTETNKCRLLNKTNDHKSTLFATYFNTNNREYHNYLSIGFPICSQNKHHILLGKFSEGNYNEDTRTFFWPKSNSSISFDHMCLEYISGDIQVIVCLEDEYTTNVDNLSEIDLFYYLYPLGLYISAIFLLATLFISYVLLPNGHHILHWKCQTNYVLCLFLGDIILATNQVAKSSFTSHPFMCSVIAASMHFLFLSAFFWLNTMCFNIWWTFRDIRPASLEKGQEIFRLRLYEIYAWGIPIFITVIAQIMDSLPTYPDFLRPKFGMNSCWFYGDKEVITYFFGPIGILLTINLILFLATARELSCGLWKRELVKSTSERATLSRICMKLVVVMGITWIFDVISWFVGGPKQIWYLTDLINSLQGLLIFIVIGCQPQVQAAAKKKFSCLFSVFTLFCKNNRDNSKMDEDDETTTHNEQRLSYGCTESTTNHSISAISKNIPLETTF